MKIAATVVLFVASLFIADGLFSGQSIGQTIKPDFLELDRTPSVSPEAEVVEDADESVIKGWIDTIRRRRSIRQSRFS